jgi:transposase-like protein
MATPKKQPQHHPAQRRYPPEIKQRAVRMVQELRRQDPADHTVIATSWPLLALRLNRSPW